MAFPIKICSICSEEFELKPDKPGFANHCPVCSDQDSKQTEKRIGRAEPQSDAELNGARRQAMRDLLYRKDS
jgi:hypothetical protein